MIINLEDHDYRVSFYHDSPRHSLRSTTCEIEQVAKGGQFKTDGKTLTTGQATCAEPDNFSKSYGRFLSMKRAMENLPLPKDLKKVFWKKYLNMR